MITQLLQARKALPKGCRKELLWSAVTGEDSPTHISQSLKPPNSQLLTTSSVPLKHLKAVWLHFPQAIKLFNIDSLLKTSCIILHVNDTKFHTKLFDLL